MNMHETLRRLRRAGLIVDFNINETGSEYSLVFQPAVPNVLLAELFGRAAKCTYQVDPNPVHSSYNWEEAQRLAKESGRDPRDERQLPGSASRLPRRSARPAARNRRRRKRPSGR